MKINQLEPINFLFGKNALVGRKKKTSSKMQKKAFFGFSNYQILEKKVILINLLNSILNFPIGTPKKHNNA
jgi:hypothetical protein